MKIKKRLIIIILLLIFVPCSCSNIDQDNEDNDNVITVQKFENKLGNSGYALNKETSIDIGFSSRGNIFDMFSCVEEAKKIKNYSFASKYKGDIYLELFTFYSVKDAESFYNNSKKKYAELIGENVIVDSKFHSTNMTYLDDNVLYISILKDKTVIIGYTEKKYIDEVIKNIKYLGY